MIAQIAANVHDRVSREMQRLKTANSSTCLFLSKKVNGQASRCHLINSSGAVLSEGLRADAVM